MKAAAPVIPIEDAKLGDKTVRRIGVARILMVKIANSHPNYRWPATWGRISTGCPTNATAAT